MNKAVARDKAAKIGLPTETANRATTVLFTAHSRLYIGKKPRSGAAPEIYI